jgi:hypothetical protein
VFPNTRITALAVLVVSGIVEVDIGGKTHTLYAGDDRQFVAGRESAKAIREMPTLIERVESDHIVVTQGEARQKKTTVPLTAELRILIDGKPGRAQDLAAGMLVHLQRFQGDDEVIGLRAEGPTISGTLQSVDAGSITLMLRRGRESKPQDRTVAVRPDTQVDIGGRAGRLKELPVGASIIVRLSVDQASAVQITLPRNREGERRK